MIHLYGIPNCDTVKKARRWLDARGIEYAFYDYKKEGAPADKLAAWVDEHGVDVVLNKRGTTYRNLTDAEKLDAGDPLAAIALLVQHPSMIKRPVVEHQNGTLVGFKEDEWSAIFC